MKASYHKSKTVRPAPIIRKGEVAFAVEVSSMSDERTRFVL
eukprot:UN13573